MKAGSLRGHFIKAAPRRAAGNRSSLFRRLFLFILILTVTALLCTGEFSYLIFRNVIIDQVSISRVSVLQQVAERTRVIKNAALTVSNLYYSDPLVQEMLTARELDDTSASRLRQHLLDTNLQYQAAFEKANVSFYTEFLADNGFRFYSGAEDDYSFDGVEKELWYQKLMQSSETSFWVGGFNDRKPNGEDRYVFSLVRTFHREGESSCASLLVNIEESYLSETYQSALRQDNSIYIVDEDGRIVSQMDKRMIGINFFDMDHFYQLFDRANYAIIKKANGMVLLSYYSDAQSNWTVVEEIPLRSLLQPLNWVGWLIVLICLAVCAAAAAVSYHFSRKTSRPLGELCGAMAEVQKGNLDVTAAIHGWEEVERLGGNFNNMLESMKRLLADVKETEQAKNKAELDFLTAQINPHFLHNTLFSIKCMIQMGSTEQADRMLGAFIELLKKTLTNPDEFVRLADEADGVYQYVLIQKYRYTNKIDLRMNLTDRARECRVPKLLLQPIVENAIFHGIEPKDGQGVIRITARIEEGDLLVDIMDDGIGMGPERMATLLISESEHAGKRIGLFNVNQRIRLFFGQPYGIVLESEPGVGTTVHLRLPTIE